MRRSLLLVACLSLLVSMLGPVAAVAGDLPGPELWLPVELNDDVQWTDTYGAPRGGGRTHKGVDMMAPQMTPVYAAESGYIARAYGGDSRECLDGGYCRDYGILLYGDSGWSTFYLHLNDDTPGRPGGCDHGGGAENAFAPRLVDVIRSRGTLEPLPARWNPQDVVRVERGELLGWVGSSGNAGCKIDHLHFEVWEGHEFKSANDSSKSNPTPYVDEAVSTGRYWGPDGPIEPVTHDRLAGQSRVGTAIALSQEAFEQADVAFIAPAEHHVEALVTAPLAAVAEAPVLLTWGTPSEGRPLVGDALVAELDRLGVTRVVAVGSSEHLAAGFEEELAERTGLAAENILRFDAPEPWSLSHDVALEILDHRGWGDPDEADAEAAQAEEAPTDEPDQVAPWLLERLLGEQEQPEQQARDASPAPVRPVVALGAHEDPDRAWPDALAAATLAAYELEPVLLVRGDDIPDEIREILERDGVDGVRIVGGTAAVSEAVEQEIRELGHDTARLAGPSRVDTALAVADAIEAAGGSVGRVFVATARNFPDALAAGAVVARLGRVLVLVDGVDTTPGPVEDWLRQRAGSVERVSAIGGVSAVSDAALRRLSVHANWPYPSDEDASGESGAGGAG